MSEAQIPANPLGTERIGKLLRGFAIPGITSMVINSLYNMVDQVFIGQGVGMLGNGATNIIAPISTVAIALSSLFGDGLATYFSLQLGKGEPEKASKAVGTAIIAGTGVSFALTAVVLVFLEPLCHIFGATNAILWNTAGSLPAVFLLSSWPSSSTELSGRTAVQDFLWYP